MSEMATNASPPRLTSIEFPAIALFTKPDCSFCNRVKALLDGKGVDYACLDTANDATLAKWSTLLSGHFSVPQVFIAGNPIGGAAELERLNESGGLDKVLDIVTSTAKKIEYRREASSENLDSALIRVKMRKYLEPSDGTQTTEPEELPILHFYKKFFGWWPNCYQYLHRYPEAYKTFIYTTLMSVAGGQARELLGEDLLCAVAFSTSEAQGCSYCQVHTAATTDHSIELVAALKKSRTDSIDPTGVVFSERDLVLTDLAAKASLNEVSDELLARVHALASENASDYIAAVGQITAVFGFLNIFNDLVSVDIEGGWNSRVQSRVTIEIADHAGNTTENPDNLDFDIPPGTESFPGMIKKYESVVGDDHESYLRKNLGFYPNWVDKWHEPYRKRHAYMYVRLMNDPDSSTVSPELRHLMARVAALTKDHEYLAAAEGFMAFHAADDKEAAIARIANCYYAACGTNSELQGPVFNAAERSALALARVSALIPLKTTQGLAKELLANYDQDAIVQLFSFCAVAGSIQRWAAVAKPKIELEVEEFYRSNNLLTSSIYYKLPMLAS